VAMQALYLHKATIHARALLAGALWAREGYSYSNGYKSGSSASASASTFTNNDATYADEERDGERERERQREKACMARAQKAADLLSHVFGLACLCLKQSPESLQPHSSVFEDLSLLCAAGVSALSRTFPSEAEAFSQCKDACAPLKGAVECMRDRCLSLTDPGQKLSTLHLLTLRRRWGEGFEETYFPGSGSGSAGAVGSGRTLHRSSSVKVRVEGSAHIFLCIPCLYAYLLLNRGDI